MEGAGRTGDSGRAVVMTEGLSGRLGIYVCGIILVSAGIVLCKRCGLGISPVSCIPFALEEVTGLSMGTLTMLFHFANIAAQMVMTGGFGNIKLWMQVPLAFVFGVTIDMLQAVLWFDGNGILMQLLMLAGSILFTALGMVCMIRMALIQNPPDGTVRTIAAMLGRELGSIKIVYDCSCVAAASLMGLFFLGRISGFGPATVLSAVFVGRTVTWINALADRQQEKR